MATTPSCASLANLRVAVTQRIQHDGHWRDGDTSFLKVNVWRGQAEHLADSLGKGGRVMVTGRLVPRAGERLAERGGDFNDAPRLGSRRSLISW